MSKIPHVDTFFWLTIVLCLLIVITSVGGIVFEEKLYALNVPFYVAQIIAQDIANLFVVVPILLISALFMRRNSRKAFFVWAGTIILTLYMFFNYCFTLHFNHLFLVYCGALGLSFYLLLIPLVTFDAEQVKDWFVRRTKTTAVIIHLVVVAGLLYVLWLSDALPASIAGEIPEFAAESGLITSPIHALDLALVFPGFFISAFLLYKKRALGYLSAPLFVGLSLVMGLSLVSMVITLVLRGFAFEVVDLAIFGTLAVVSGAILVRFLRYCTDD